MGWTRVAAVVALSGLAAGAPGCGSRAPEDAPAREAFAALLKGLEAADASALWDLSDDATRRLFDELAGQIRQAAECIGKHYAAKDRDAAVKAVGGVLAGLDGTGRALFLAAIDPARLRVPEDPASREVDRVERKGDVVVVVTKAGESVELRRDGEGRLRTGMFLDSFGNLPSVKTLRENLAVAQGNCKALAAAAAQAQGANP
jgi:hypothetical protein